MSYSNSEKAVHKVSHFLEIIAQSKSDTVNWLSEKSNTLGYQIRQALVIAENNPDKYPEWSKLKRQWRIKVSGHNVTAARITPMAELQEKAITVQQFTKTVSTFSVAEVKDPMEVIGAIIANPNFEEYSFPDYTEPTELELNRIFKWTSKNQCYVVKSINLIVSRREPPEDIQWKPTLVAI
jgi:hypothetical protein